MRAAVELLVDHGMWLNREEFVDRYISRSGSVCHIDFTTVADDLAAGTAPGASATETAILRLAADLATDRWRISKMSDATVHLVRVAIATATE